MESSSNPRQRTVPFTQIGGARIDSFNATFPFARLAADAEALHLTCLGRRYHFPRRCLRRLCRVRGWLSIGLRIEHTQKSLPSHVVFWASLFFRGSGFEKLSRRLQELGYEVVA